MNDEKKPMTLEDFAQEMRAGFMGMQEQFSGVQQQFSDVRQQFTGQKQYMQEGFETLSAKIDVIDENKPDKGDVNMKLEKITEVINERTFTPDEKASLLATARFIDKRLEEETRGENNIPLTRPEYDAVIEEVDLPNRFIDGLKAQQA
ncbi:MAG: hypothetical protein HYT94_00035 [Parcubacteria group bacterium]|nr:hypothetical protein [Parcubacteria group bacterium]